jgi:hypothetical protein
MRLPSVMPQPDATSAGSGLFAGSIERLHDFVLFI